MVSKVSPLSYTTYGCSYFRTAVRVWLQHPARAQVRPARAASSQPQTPAGLLEGSVPRGTGCKGREHALAVDFFKKDLKAKPHL